MATGKLEGAEVMTSGLTREFDARLGALLFLVATLLATGLASVDAAGHSGREIVALHAYGDGEVIVVDSRALYRVGAASRTIEPVAPPPSVSSISAVAANRFGRIYLAAPGSGVWVSRNGGKTWAARNDGLPRGAVTSLTTHAGQVDTVYAYVSGDGIYRSEDGRDTWLLMDGGPEGMTGPFIHSDMPGSMQTGWLFAATKNGISRSMDCFCLWRRARALDGEVFALTYDPRQPAHIYAATGKGVFRSQDGGERWESASAAESRIQALAFTTTGVLYAAAAGGAIYVSANQAKSWQRADGF